MFRKKRMNISSNLADVRIGGVGINRIGEDCKEKFFKGFESLPQNLIF